MNYRVRWEIDLDAENPREAAELALEIQRDPESTAVVFDIFDGDVHVDRVDLADPPSD